MIGDPVNDEACLGEITQTISMLVDMEDATLTELAARFGTTRELAAWIRSLPQRDDEGDPGDGPKVHACSPPQRLRIAPLDANCVERAATYIGVAELIDPRPERRLTTIEVPGGRHTLPIEDGSPVVLDPRVPRNAARASLYRTNRARNGASPVALTPQQAVDWIALLASEPAHCFRGGLARVRSGHRAMRALIAGLPIDAEQVGDIAFVLGLAHHEAHLYGDLGRRVIGTTVVALDRLDDGNLVAATRNAPSIRVGPVRIGPDFEALGKLGRIGGRLGYRVGVAAVREKLASLGFTRGVLHDLESELNREGWSLGPLAKPAPMPGTLAAVTPDALAGRWIARRL